MHVERSCICRSYADTVAADISLARAYFVLTLGSVYLLTPQALRLLKNADVNLRNGEYGVASVFT